MWIWKKIVALTRSVIEGRSTNGQRLNQSNVGCLGYGQIFDATLKWTPHDNLAIPKYQLISYQPLASITLKTSVHTVNNLSHIFETLTALEAVRPNFRHCHSHWKVSCQSSTANDNNLEHAQFFFQAFYRSVNTRTKLYILTVKYRYLRCRVSAGLKIFSSSRSVDRSNLDSVHHLRWLASAVCVVPKKCFSELTKI